MYAQEIAGLYRGRKARLKPSLYDPLTIQTCKASISRHKTLETLETS
jgi:hypothetical protein